MGCVETITADKWPAQNFDCGRRVLVCFHYDTTKTTPGTVVRDDMESPYVTIIRLDDGRHVLSTECQFQEIPPC